MGPCPTFSSSVLRYLLDAIFFRGGSGLKHGGQGREISVPCIYIYTTAHAFSIWAARAGGRAGGRETIFLSS